MIQTWTDDALMPADEYGRRLPKFSSKLLVRHLASSLPFYREVLDATVRYADDDFAVLTLLGTDFMLHADHAYDHHPLSVPLQAARERGVGGASFSWAGPGQSGGTGRTRRSHSRATGEGFRPRMARSNDPRPRRVHLDSRPCYSCVKLICKPTAWNRYALMTSSTVLKAPQDLQANQRGLE